MKDDKQRLDQTTSGSGGLGDDQGTRIGSPTPGAGRKTGAGAEATEGIHNSDEGAPLASHDTEHRSKYGGGSRREDDSGQRPA